MEYLLYNYIKPIIKNDLKNINSSILVGGFDKLPTQAFQDNVIKLLQTLKGYTGYEDLKNKLNLYKSRLENLDTKLGEEGISGYLNIAKEIQSILDPFVDDTDPTKGHIISNLFKTDSPFTIFVNNYKKFLDEKTWNEDRIALDTDVYEINDPDKYNIYIKTDDSIDKFNIKLKLLFAPFLNNPNNNFGQNIEENIASINELIEVSKRFSSYIIEKKKIIENILYSSYAVADIKFEDNTNGKIKDIEYLIDLQNVQNNGDLHLGAVYNIDNNITNIIEFVKIRDEMNSIGKIDIFDSNDDLSVILNIENAVQLQTGGDFESKYYVTNSGKQMLKLSKNLEKLFEILDTTLDDAKYLKQLQLRYNFYIAYLFLIIRNSASKLDPTDNFKIYEYFPKEKSILYSELLNKINNNFSNINSNQIGLIYFNKYHYLTINKLIKLLELLKINFPSTHLIDVLKCTNNIKSDLILLNHFRLILIKFCKTQEGMTYLPTGKTFDDL